MCRRPAGSGKCGQGNAQDGIRLRVTDNLDRIRPASRVSGVKTDRKLDHFARLDHVTQRVGRVFEREPRQPVQEPHGSHVEGSETGVVDSQSECSRVTVLPVGLHETQIHGPIVPAAIPHAILGDHDDLRFADDVFFVDGRRVLANANRTLRQIERPPILVDTTPEVSVGCDTHRPAEQLNVPRQERQVCVEVAATTHDVVGDRVSVAVNADIAGRSWKDVDVRVLQSKRVTKFMAHCIRDELRECCEGLKAQVDRDAKLPLIVWLHIEFLGQCPDSSNDRHSRILQIWLEENVVAIGVQSADRHRTRQIHKWKRRHHSPRNLARHRPSRTCRSIAA